MRSWFSPAVFIIGATLLTAGAAARAEVYCTAEGDAASNIKDCATVLLRVGISDEERADAFNNRAVNYIELGDLGAATADLEKAIALVPTNASYLANAAYVLEAQGDLDGAFTMLQLALRNEKNPEAKKFIEQDIARLEREQD